MMNSEQKLIAAGIVIFIIAVAVTYGILNYLGYISLDLEEDTDEPTLLRQEVLKDVKEYKMIRRIKQRDLILTKENFTQLSDYQKYVTPNNETVRLYLTSNAITSVQEAYASAVNWIWVSDSVLHGKLEHWLMPAEFISDTPTDPDNPIFGSMVSDCESQAYTLVSILEALGTPKTDVRVVVGLVDFEGTTGGHAWVEVYQNGNWFELEATSGPYWDEDDLELVESNGFPFNYFKTHPYPVEEYWAYFNDIYYYNPVTGLKNPNLPIHWL